MSSNEPVVPTDSGSSTKLLAAVVLLVTFVAGAVIGVIADRAVLLARFRPSPRGPEFIVHRLDRRLNLNDQQHAEVTRIVERHQARIVTTWAGIRPQIRHEIEAANAEIEQVLTPGQRVEFAKMKLRLQPRRGPGGRMHPDSD